MQMVQLVRVFQVVQVVAAQQAIIQETVAVELQEKEITVAQEMPQAVAPVEVVAQEVPVRTVNPVVQVTVVMELLLQFQEHR
jgi:hypothetical protein